MWELTFPNRDRDPFSSTVICPICGSEHVHKHGYTLRRRRRIPLPAQTILRRRCTQCGATWSEYPAGMAPHCQRSLFAQKFGVLLYALGLTYRQTSALLKELGMPAAPATILADVRASSAKARMFHQQLRRRTRIQRLPLPHAGDQEAPADRALLIAVNHETGEGIFVHVEAHEDVEDTWTLISQALKLWQEAGQEPQADSEGRGTPHCRPALDKMDNARDNSPA